MTDQITESTQRLDIVEAEIRASHCYIDRIQKLENEILLRGGDLARANDRNKQLEEALKPFADAARWAVIQNELPSAVVITDGRLEGRLPKDNFRRACDVYYKGKLE